MYQSNLTSVMGLVALGDQMPRYTLHLYKQGLSGWMERALYRPEEQLWPAAIVQHINPGDVVVVLRPALDAILRAVTSKTPRFVLVTVNYDDPVTAVDRRRVVGTPSIVAFFAQNLMAGPGDSKIFPLPLGLPLHAVQADGGAMVIERQVLAVRRAWSGGSLSASVPQRRRKDRILVIQATPSYLAHMSREAYCNQNQGYALRCLYADKLARLPYVDVMHRVPIARYLETVASYAFVLSPPGNGYDCFRTWEALAVGTVPIVHNDGLYDKRLFDGTGAWVVSSPDEVVAQFESMLAEIHHTSRDKTQMPSVLQLGFWRHWFKKAANNYMENSQVEG